MVFILFVCLGNICRSPAGEEILRQMGKKEDLKDLQVKSCGIGDWHVGELPHPPMRSHAEKRGYQLSSRAEQFHPQFFNKYDWILAADHEVFNDLLSLAKTDQEKDKIVFITEHSKKYHQEEIPDPYQGKPQTFEHVLDMLEDACKGWIQFLNEKNQKEK